MSSLDRIRICCDGINNGSIKTVFVFVAIPGLVGQKEQLKAMKALILN